MLCCTYVCYRNNLRTLQYGYIHNFNHFENAMPYTCNYILLDKNNFSEAIIIWKLTAIIKKIMINQQICFKKLYI